METLFITIDLSTFDNIIAFLKRTRQPETTFQEFTEIREQFIPEKHQILTTIKKMTIAQIKKHVTCYGDTKKDRLVTLLWESLLGEFDIMEGMVSYTMGGSYEESVLVRIYTATEEDFQSWKDARAKKQAAYAKAMTNPETLEEFRTFIMRHREGEKALSAEQRAIYDEVRTGISREQRQQDAERKAQIAVVAVGSTDLIILDSYHAKKQIPLWVVRLSERVDRPIFDTLKDRAQQLGGYYSSYRGQGAISGFTFERKDAAQLFIQIKDGDVNASELRTAINAEKQQYRGERVQEKAATIEERATEELNRDRKDNTARRARMATSAEQRAIKEIEFSNTLDEIGKRMANGTLKYLDKLANIVQLEGLYNILSNCKYAYFKDKKIRWEEFTYTGELSEYAKYPYPLLYKHESLNGMLQRLSNDTGKLLATKRMFKRLQSEKGEFYTVREGKAMEDYIRLFCCSSRSLPEDERANYKEIYQKYIRIYKLGITTSYELRTALRELISIDQEGAITPEIKRLQDIRELDRKFTNLQIPGFFPTPSKLAGDLVKKAQIEDGHSVLEPSAGLGHLAQAILEAHPDTDLQCVEYYQPLAEALELKGLNALHGDFLQITDRVYDRIVMNPPFENLADIEHVRHAWTLLKPGGRLVAIMANNKSGERGAIREFVDFVEKYGSIEENPENAFRSGFRPTGIRTLTIVIDKPHI